MGRGGVPVALYVPNLIGYFRIISGLASFYYAFSSPLLFFFTYGLSQMLDAVDGVAARALGQTSQFGGVLDMVTDRFCTAGLLVVLGRLYEHMWLPFLFLMFLDVVSHWCKMYSSMLVRASHKSQSANKIALLRFYYTFPYALFTLCVGSEGFLLFLYLSYWTTGPEIPALAQEGQAPPTLVPVLMWVCTPFFLLKQAISVVQLWDAMATIAEEDEKERASKGK